MKSGPKPGTFSSGTDPRRGKGPPKGHGGRPTNQFVIRCGYLVDEKVLPTLQRYLEQHDPSDQGYRWVVDHLMAYGKGKPVQPVGPALEDDAAIPFAVRIVE